MRGMIRWWNDPVRELSFLGIPKTGSTSIRNALEIDDRCWTKLPQYPDRTFTVLRDPIERARSSYAECKRRGTLRGEKSFTGFLRSLTDGFYDEHAEPQTYYFQSVQHVFKLEWIHEFEEWAGVRLPISNRSEPEEKPIVDEQTELAIRILYAEDFKIYSAH